MQEPPCSGWITRDIDGAAKDAYSAFVRQTICRGTVTAVRSPLRIIGLGANDENRIAIRRERTRHHRCIRADAYGLRVIVQAQYCDIHREMSVLGRGCRLESAKILDLDERA